MMDIVKTELDLPLLNRGKVRDTYIYGEKLLMIATDRMSAFDVVFSEAVPFKGNVLNQLSKFWFEQTKHIVDNHFITDKIPDELPEYLHGRSMIVQRTLPLKIECVVRGFITGGGFKEYQKGGKICGIKLPPNLKNGSELPEPIFTPTTKGEVGTHDLSINHDEAQKIIGKENYEYVKKKSVELYKFASNYVRKRGLILADTKFEFGLFEKEDPKTKKKTAKIILIDEALTPDSSRYWIKEKYDQGILESLDKQFLRDYLEKTNWNKTPPAPKLPKEIIEKTSKRYIEAYEKITGKKLDK